MLLLALTLAAAPVKVAAMEWSHSGVDQVYTATLESRFMDLLSANGLRVTSPKDVGAVLGFERQRQMLGCGNNESCIAELAGALGVDALLYGSVAKGGTSYTVTLRLVNAKDAQPISSFSERLRSEDLMQDWLDAKAREIAAAALRVLRGASTGATGGGDAAAVVRASEPVRPYRGISWIPGVVAVLGLAAGVIGFIEANVLYGDLTHELSTTGQVTARAQSDASTGKTMQIVGWIGAGVAVAGLAAAAVLFFLGSPGEVTPVAFVGPTGGGVGVSLRL
jgi:hypothetical protein